ncbi:hypothetical protein SprV_0301258800 [Sparganum proliferum]
MTATVCSASYRACCSCSLKRMASTADRYIDAFIAADKDGSGTLTRDELVTVLRQNGMSSKKADKLMQKLDLNGDGIITLGEYKVALNISSQPMDVWKSLFESLDKDGSGTVGTEELKAFLCQSGAADLQETVDAWIEDYDINKDGQLDYNEFLDKSGEIDAEELVRFLKESGSSHLIPAVKEWIKDYDVNGDGKLQYREFLCFVASTEC